MSKISPTIESCKGNDIEKPGLQNQKVKALYPKGEIKYIPMRILSYLQSGHEYYYICFLRLIYKAGQVL